MVWLFWWLSKNAASSSLQQFKQLVLKHVKKNCISTEFNLKTAFEKNNWQLWII
jgi:hypothetical protein